eukprot:scaffold1350_cov56-Cyclotella_meneghiniana.AAC.37
MKRKRKKRKSELESREQSREAPFIECEDQNMSRSVETRSGGNDDEGTASTFDIELQKQNERCKSQVMMAATYSHVRRARGSLKTRLVMTVAITLALLSNAVLSGFVVIDGGRDVMSGSTTRRVRGNESVNSIRNKDFVQSALRNIFEGSKDSLMAVTLDDMRSLNVELERHSHKSVTVIGEGNELQSGIMTESEVNLCCCKGLSCERNEDGIVMSNITARECVAGRVKIDDDAPNTRSEVNVVAGNDDCCMKRESLESFEAISIESGESSLESMKAILIETGVSLEVDERSSFIVGPKKRQHQHDKVVGPRRRQYQHVEVVGPVGRLDQRNEMSHHSIETIEAVGPERRLNQHDDDIVGPERRLHQLLFWIVHAETSEVENGSGRRLYHLVRNDILGMELEASESFAARIIELKNVTQGECDTREYITRVCASIEPSCDDWNIARVEKNVEDSRTCGVACGVELNDVSVDAHTSADEVDGKEQDRAGGAIVNVNAANTLIDETGMTCKNTKHGRVLYGCTWHSFDEDDEAGADVISGGAESNQMTWADIAHEVDQFTSVAQAEVASWRLMVKLLSNLRAIGVSCDAICTFYIQY